MPGHDFNPWGEPRPCWWCQWYGGISPEGRHGLCDRPRACRVTALPERGCAFYEREPGADDEPAWVPVEVIDGPAVWITNAARSLAGPWEWAP